MFDEQDDDENNSNPWTYPLQWGLKKSDMQAYLAKNHPKVRFYHTNNGYGEGRECIAIGEIQIFNFIGDCGAVYLCGANYATKPSLDAVLGLMSECGFSKIFATLVNKSKDIENEIEIFKQAGFTVVDDGFSNRNDTKRDVVLFKRINCVYKGY